MSESFTAKEKLAMLQRLFFDPESQLVQIFAVKI